MLTKRIKNHKIIIRPTECKQRVKLNAVGTPHTKRSDKITVQ